MNFWTNKKIIIIIDWWIVIIIIMWPSSHYLMIMMRDVKISLSFGLLSISLSFGQFSNVSIFVHLSMGGFSVDWWLFGLAFVSVNPFNQSINHFSCLIRYMMNTETRNSCILFLFHFQPKKINEKNKTTFPIYIHCVLVWLTKTVKWINEIKQIKSLQPEITVYFSKMKKNA